MCRLDGLGLESEFEEEEEDREGAEGRRLEEERRRVGMMRTMMKLKLRTPLELPCAKTGDVDRLRQCQ